MGTIVFIEINIILLEAFDACLIEMDLNVINKCSSIWVLSLVIINISKDISFYILLSKSNHLNQFVTSMLETVYVNENFLMSVTELRFLSSIFRTLIWWKKKWFSIRHLKLITMIKSPVQRCHRNHCGR